MADGRHSVTHYETLEAHRFASLLEVHLETGRTHQIRVHMAALKHPCVGDLTYGADPTLAKRVGLERQWLHAVRLGFEHPDTGEQVEYESELPRRPGPRARGHPRCRLTLTCCGRPTAGRRPTRSPTCSSPPARRPRCRRASTPTTRSAPGWPAGSRPTRSGSPRATARSSGTPGSPPPGSTTCTSSPPHAGQGVGSALLDLVKAQRPDGFCLWVFEMNTPGARLLRRATAWSSSSAPTAPATRRRRRTSGWPGPAPTRCAFLRGLIDEVDEQLGDLLARRAALTARRPGAQGRRRPATPTASPRSPRRWPAARPRSGASGSPGSCTRSSPRASTRPPSC